MDSVIKIFKFESNNNMPDTCSISFVISVYISEKLHLIIVICIYKIKLFHIYLNYYQHS